jgi:hypothetical protein
MLDERSLNLRRRQSMPRDIDDIVHASSDPVVAFVVAPSTVSGELDMSVHFRPMGTSTYVVALIHIQVCVHVSLMCSPDCACHTGPWLLECQDALHVVSVDLLA